MTPKEKALELVEKYLIKVEVYFLEDSIPRICNAKIRLESAKQFALVAVDEVLNLCWNGNEVGLIYWQEVKQEIEKL